MPDNGRLRGRLPAPRGLGYGGDAGTSLETGMFNFATRCALRQVDRRLAGGAGPENRRSALHGPELPGPGGRRADVERLHRHAPMAALPPVRRQANPRSLVSRHPEVARFRRLKDRRSCARVLPELRHEDARMEFPRRLGEPATSGAATGPRPRPGDSDVDQQLSLPLHASAGGQDGRRPGKDRRRGEIREDGRRGAARLAPAVL